MRPPYALTADEEAAEHAAERLWLDAVAYLRRPAVRELVLEYAATLVREYDGDIDADTARAAAADVLGARPFTTTTERS